MEQVGVPVASHWGEKAASPRKQLMWGSSVSKATEGLSASSWNGTVRHRPRARVLCARQRTSVGIIPKPSPHEGALD